MQLRRGSINVIFVISSTLLSWYHMIYIADTNPIFFSDEVPHVQSAVSFFKDGSYKSNLYGLVYSSGLAVTWPSAIGWYLGGNLFFSRLACIFFSWFMALMLGLLNFKRQSYSTIDSLTISTCLWALLITSPFAMPYWFGFMYNLGELNSAIGIGYALLIISRRPLIAAFILGLVIWHGKVIYALFVWSILIANAFVERLSDKKMLRVIFCYLVVFFLPLFIWMLWLLIIFEMSTLQQWLTGQFRWFGDMMSRHQSVQTYLDANSILERFNSPQLEWVTYSFGTKIKNLLIPVGAIGVTLYSLRLNMKGTLVITDREKWFSIFLIGCICIHTIYHFLFHPYMWQRHFQSTLYCGFGLLTFWIWKWNKGQSFGQRRLFYTCGLILLVSQGVQLFNHPLMSSEISSVRQCTDLYSVQCDPYQAEAERNIFLRD